MYEPQHPFIFLCTCVKMWILIFVGSNEQMKIFQNLFLDTLGGLNSGIGRSV